VLLGVLAALFLKWGPLDNGVRTRLPLELHALLASSTSENRTPHPSCRRTSGHVHTMRKLLHPFLHPSQVLAWAQFDFEFFVVWLLPPIIFEAGFNMVRCPAMALSCTP
jgi:hypothetical protein